MDDLVHYVIVQRWRLKSSIKAVVLLVVLVVRVRILCGYDYYYDFCSGCVFFEWHVLNDAWPEAGFLANRSLNSISCTSLPPMNYSIKLYVYLYGLRTFILRISPPSPQPVRWTFLFILIGLSGICSRGEDMTVYVYSLVYTYVRDDGWRKTRIFGPPTKIFVFIRIVIKKNKKNHTKQNKNNSTAENPLPMRFFTDLRPVVSDEH